jgi:hypothetical protein
MCGGATQNVSAHIDETNLAQTSSIRFVQFRRTLRSQLHRLSDATLFLMFVRSRTSSANWQSTKGYCVMIDVGGTILQISVIALTVAVKGHQEGIVQQQIKTMGLRQWLSLAVAWIVNWFYTETSSLSEFISPPPRTLSLKLVAVKRAVPTKLSVLERSIFTGPTAR